MKNLHKYAKECVAELKAIGIYPPTIASYTINSRAATRWGQCSRRNGIFSINIASVLLADNAPDIALKSTLIHEILHTLPRCFNHGAIWQMYADKVNKAYGYNVKRTDTYKDKGFTTNPLAEAHPYKYRIKCNVCHREWNYRRDCATVDCCRHNTGTCPCGAKNFTVINLR